MSINLIVPIILGVITAVAAVNWIYFKILKIALDKKLVDIPDARKLQKRPIPVVGGLAVFFGVLAGMMIAAVFNQLFSPDEIHISLFPILAAMGMMLYIGAMDDIIGLTPKSRFIIEIATILCLIFSSGMCIDTFRGMWGVESFSWWIAVPLTIFAGVGIINAINSKWIVERLVHKLLCPIRCGIYKSRRYPKCCSGAYNVRSTYSILHSQCLRFEVQNVYRRCRHYGDGNSLDMVFNLHLEF